MRAVIVLAERQKDVVGRLVSYIRNLDGTEVLVVPTKNETDEYPKRNNYALREAAEAVPGEAFFWLEPDSVPLCAGWLDRIEAEYLSSGKEFMLSSDKNPPFDLIGGIGVYGPSTRWLIPKDVPEHGWGWDTWMDRHIPHTIHKTPLIQHSYGIYPGIDSAEPHRFPRDSHLLRPSSVIFHRDKFQDLISTTA